jgi:hypothetical protein
VSDEVYNKYDYPMLDDDDGTMMQNVTDLADAIVGHRIVKVEQNAPVESVFNTDYWTKKADVIFTLDNGRRVVLIAGGDCCAYTELMGIVEHLPTIDHIITAVEPDGDYNNWHIFADFGEVMELEVGWSAGNPFFYGYGFNIQVLDIEDDE